MAFRMHTPRWLGRSTTTLIVLTMACANPELKRPAVDKPAERSSTMFETQPKSALLAQTSLALAYSGFRSGQHPDRGAGAKNPTADQILEDLRLLTQNDHFRLIRLYDAGENSRAVLDVIAKHELPMKVMLGAWLSGELSNHEGCAWVTEPVPQEALDANKKKNGEEVNRAIALANEFSDVVVAVNIGNESLVTWNDHLVTIEAMVTYLKKVKAAIRQPVTTADNYVPWIDHGPKLAEVVDFAAIHTYPVWEQRDIDQGLSYTLENMVAVQRAIPQVPLAIGEAGWPSVASEFGPRASQAKQKQYFEELTGWAAAHNVTTFVFEAFDEDWKGNPDDPMGAEKHWGLFTVDRRPKRVMQPWYPDLEPASPSL